MTKDRQSNTPYHKIYRTKNLTQIRGEVNKKNVQFLLNQIKYDNTGIVYVLQGRPGLGKTSTSYNIVQAVNCENLSEEGVPCDTCESCVGLLSNPRTNPDVFIINGAVTNKVDDIKQIVETVKIRSPKYKKLCIVIEEFHNLTGKSLEALLGIFEDARMDSSTEGCHYMFIVSTTEGDKLPPALLSRAHTLTFKPLNRDELSEYLTYVSEDQDLEYEEEAFKLIYDKTRGGVRDSLQLLERIAWSNDFYVSKEAAECILHADKSKIAPKIFKSILSLNTPKAVKLSKDFASKNGIQENDFNDLIELFDNYIDDEDCLFDELTIIKVIETLNQKRDEFLRTSSIRYSDIFSLAIRSTIAILRNETLKCLERKLASKNLEFTERLFNLYPQIKVVDGDIMLILQEPTERVKWMKNGLESSFVSKTFDSLNIDGYIFE